MHLISHDGETFDVPYYIALQSKLIECLVEDAASGNDVPLVNVKARVLAPIIAFMRRYPGYDPPPLRKTLLNADLRHPDNQIPPADVEFILAVEYDLLFEIVLATNYMDYQPLLNLCIARLASDVKSRSVEDLKRQFTIIKEFSPEEEARVRAENAWVEEA